MSEPPNNPQRPNSPQPADNPSAPDDPQPPNDPQPADHGWQPPDATGSPPVEGAPSAAPSAQAAETAAPEASEERPPPYQGAYGGLPAYPSPAQPGQDPQGHAQPGYGPPAPGQPPYGQPAYAPLGHGGPGDGLAGRGARLGAAVLDGLIVGVVSVPFVVQAIRWDRLKEAADAGTTVDATDIYDIPRLLAGYAIAFVLGFAYYTVLHVRYGQTIGKRAAGIRLVRADDRSAVSWGQVLARQGFVYALTIGTAVLNLVGPLGGVVGLAGLLDNAWILWDPRRQSVHDKIAGTVVVKVTPWTSNPYAKS
ncbi:RDD family protein [Actinomadura roseirufa]|uniref:RDD family protein n=1 Tax=Actinomadura roseirufa TaxID=2094049 RepID=UPI0010413A1E|nr:RDD family protein [Actinomadura roseirufa]